ncbi:MAG TPA: monovalent cation/H+ antiporter subunit D family protein [Firmicutes bacterium]|nr:monovalent cation/H+ antiporter subunit D family protein [Bacillota bacterium]
MLSLLVLILLPVLTGCFLLLFAPPDKVAWRLALSASVLAAAGALQLLAGPHPRLLFAYRFTPIVSLALVMDAMGLLFALIASCLWVFTVIYSHGYMAHEERLRSYLAFLILSLGITNGIALAGNLVTLFFFYEALTLVTFPLVIHRHTPEAMRAGIVYLAYNLAGATLVLLAIATLAGHVHKVDFIYGGIIPPGLFTRVQLVRLVILFVAGFGVKAAVIPLHHWLPRAMVAPTPVSALLHAVAVVNAGVFGLLRVWAYILGAETLRAMGLAPLLRWPMAATIILGSIWAFRQDDLKRRLAYSTISQLAYMGLGASFLSPSGWTAALLHFFNHALLKITLFFCAGNLAIGSGKTRVSELGGVGFSQPWTLAAFTVASGGMIGLPPVNGFLSKWYLGLGALEAGLPGMVGVILLSALLNAGYFLPIVFTAFRREPAAVPAPSEPPLTMLLPTLLLGAGCLVFFFWPQLPLLLAAWFQGGG